MTASSGDGRRIVALWFPRLSTDRLQRQWKRSGSRPSPEAKDAPPLVVAGKTGNALTLAAIDRKASQIGLRVGMPLADARAMLPALHAVNADEPADAALLEAIAEWCVRYTPFVALAPPQCLFLDVTGAAHLFAGEKALLAELRLRLRGQGLAVQAALAGSASAARGLACFADGTLASPGCDAAMIAALPVEALPLDPSTIFAFRRAGLKTIGQVASRQRSELTARFGPEMMAVLDAMQGRDDKPISPRRPLPDYSAEQRFADPIVTEEAVLQTLMALTETLSVTLEERGEGARHLEAVFFRADGAVRRIAVETGAPTRDARMIGRLFRERLDALTDPLDPGFGYDVIRLEAHRIERADGETPHFDSRAQEEKELRFLIDRLAARYGSQRILAFQPNDTHIPEAAFAVLPAQYVERSDRAAPRPRETKEPPRRPLRLFAKPEPVEVIPPAPVGPPQAFRWRRVLRPIRRAEGPERIAMEWWRHSRPQQTRDYYRVEDIEGRRFWLYRDGVFVRESSGPHWYIHGLFA